MPNLTIRDIPDSILQKIKILSKTARRSINSEVLLIIESGLKNLIEKNTSNSNINISRETQLEIWKNISGKWEDDRKTEDIIAEIYNSRTKGRDIEL